MNFAFVLGCVSLRKECISARGQEESEHEKEE